MGKTLESTHKTHKNLAELNFGKQEIQRGKGNSNTPQRGQDGGVGVQKRFFFAY